MLTDGASSSAMMDIDFDFEIPEDILQSAYAAPVPFKKEMEPVWNKVTNTVLSRKESLAIYYRYLFPCEQFIDWLAYNDRKLLPRLALNILFRKDIG